MESKDRQIKGLVKLNDELENYFKNTVIPQLYIDGDLILRKFTPPAMKQFSLHSRDLGKPIDDVKDNFRYPTIKENIQEVIDSNEILEKEIQTTDFRWYQMNIIPYVVYETNKTNGVIITFVEITLRIKDLKDLEKLISEHETLLDAVSHDIKGPLTNLLLTISLLKKVPDEKPERSKSLFNILESAIVKMQVVINELVDVRKQELHFQEEREVINFESILEDVRLTIAGNLEESGTLIKSKINVTEINFSRRKLRSIIYNLVSNAVKFQSKNHKPEILISTCKEKDFVVISVKDNGIGIDASKQEAIFSKYFRVENAIEGSGIGLYLVNEIVNNSGGKIVLKSEPGKGSEFKVYLKAE